MLEAYENGMTYRFTLSYNTLYITAITTSKHWRKLAKFQNPGLKKIIATLPKILAASRQANTMRVYISAYRRFEQWAKGYEELSVYPSNSLAITIYVLSLVQTGKHLLSIRQFLYSAPWMHRTGGYDNPTNNFMVKSVLDGAKRTLAVPTQRKLPITPKILKKIYKQRKRFPNGMDLAGYRLMAFLLIAYAGFMRCDEALKIKRSDIAFHSSYVAIFVLQSKTDVYRHGRSILIARSGTSLDPVVHLYRYLRAAKIPDKSKDYIFRRIAKTKSGNQTLSPQKKHISYSSMKDTLKQALNDLGYNSTLYGTHSLRAGGATAAAKSGISERLFKVHGRWRSDDSKDRYIQDSINKRLRVTLNLGL